MKLVETEHKKIGNAYKTQESKDASDGAGKCNRFARSESSAIHATLTQCNFYYAFFFILGQKKEGKKPVNKDGKQTKCASPKSTSPKGNTPKGTSPKGKAPKSTTRKNTSPKSTSPKSTTSKSTSPRSTPTKNPNKDSTL